MHDTRPQFQIEVTLHALLCDILRKSFRMTTLKLSSKQIAEPPLQEGGDSSKEKKPDSPAWRPKANTRSFADRTGIEAVVDQMLQILTHTYLPHQPIFVPVHASELTDVVECVLQPVRKLVGINVTETVLDMRVDDKFG